MFYILTPQNIEKVKSQLQKTIAKIDKLGTPNDTKNQNKLKHLNECKESLQRCLDKSDSDKYDYFIRDIYVNVWGNTGFRADEVGEDHPALKVDVNEPNLPTLKELAADVLKDEIDNLINNSDEMKLRNSEFSSDGIPYKISIRQAKLALLGAGLLDDIENAMASTDRSVQISWEYATEFERDNPLILYFQSQLNLSKEQVDNLFIQAKEL
ncbi:hypothetical protein [uncultured Campylobacter sp.]|uniref:hypothetical protein n=1 Tax=uncultured Campylobacter sp. TaxID=218934 RepID=UPI00262E8C5B|nr:hypothetical protein [uncultured Campylobacter sp.]